MPRLNRPAEKHWLMQACSCASQRGVYKSLVAMRQALCCERQAMAQGSAFAAFPAKAKKIRTARTAIPPILIDANRNRDTYRLLKPGLGAGRLVLSKPGRLMRRP
ncbi:protein of unknown function [Hyphomicrobium sp. MC1]|nr:protein of unknown function [Hyphomicrobium sp. MC1]